MSVNPWPHPSMTVGDVRRLLAKASRIRRPRVVLGVPNGRARAIIGDALRGRPATGPVSPFVVDIARRLALAALFVLGFVQDAQAQPAGPPVLVGCNIPRDLCAGLEADCLAACVDPDRCAVLGLVVCAADKCLACDRALDACEAAAGDCEAIADRCDDALAGCGCETPSCPAVTWVDLPHLLATCYAFPLALGCENPSVGQCLTTLPWEDCGGLTTCEYHACMLAIEQRATCTEEVPAECAEVVECVAAEAVGGD